MVRAKFTVSSVEKTMGSAPAPDEEGNYLPVPVFNIKMNPVYGDGDPEHENTKFFNATPGGNIELYCVNENAAEIFEVGQEYYVNFTPAEE